jgi:hypothetical protein
MLHADDVADFLIRAIEDEFSPNTGIVNLSAAHQITLLELVNLINSYFPKVKFDFDDSNTLYTRPVPVNLAKKLFDWVALREFNNELSTVVDIVKSGLKPSKYDWNWVLRELSNYQEIFKWLELILGITLAQYLSDFTGIMIQFKYVDFRLLFVVLMSMVYGLRIGLIAAILAGLSILYTWSQLGLDWAILAYNIGNWFPFAVYLRLE